jgi:hypothetical protein
MAKNSPILFVQRLNFSLNISAQVSRSTPLYSITQGLPEQAASTAMLFLSKGISSAMISVLGLSERKDS